MMISTFNCYIVHEIAPDGLEVDGIFWLGLINIRCISENEIEIVSAVLSILIIFKNRGLHTFLLFGIVFCMRELIDLPFFRGSVSVRTSGFVIVIELLKLSFYKFISNYLIILPWSLFGVIRLLKKKWLLTSELRSLVDIEKKQLKENIAPKYGVLFDLDPLSEQNQNQTIPSPLFG
ncbi:MAG: hypothetical protein EZS28_002000 [Streblomastix strix]|uniref:Uncharacterized protein n=1 Tax=Streblomastix strix TaxID=222440 RepID=A0A5J4X6S8_9EUKA|nr:MAG: hypothetical protein EZS28_002000 [Streblomastix strix]